MKLRVAPFEASKEIYMLLRVGFTLLFAFGGMALPAIAASVSDLSWLAGCWVPVDGEAGSGEQWMAPAGGALLGVGRTVKNGRTVEHEFMQIREVEPGKIVFIAHPSGQSEASFPLAKASEREVVFENLVHDFPQRVIYKLDGDGILRASIEGLSKGQIKTIEFPMKKVDCETQR
jgi:uncharacterized protein DUF6265